MTLLSAGTTLTATLLKRRSSARRATTRLRESQFSVGRIAPTFGLSRDTPLATCSGKMQAGRMRSSVSIRVPRRSDNRLTVWIELADSVLLPRSSQTQARTGHPMLLGGARAGHPPDGYREATKSAYLTRSSRWTADPTLLKNVSNPFSRNFT